MRWRYFRKCNDWRRPARPCPPEITSDLGRQLWSIIDATPFDRCAFNRAITVASIRQLADEYPAEVGNSVLLAEWVDREVR